MSDCETRLAALQMLSDGELASNEAAELGRHLARCPTCAATWRQVQEQNAALRRFWAKQSARSMPLTSIEARLLRQVAAPQMDNPLLSRLGSWTLGFAAVVVACEIQQGLGFDGGAVARGIAQGLQVQGHLAASLAAWAIGALSTAVLCWIASRASAAALVNGKES